VRVSRVGDGQVVGRVAPGDAAVLVLPPDRIRRPWTVTVTGDASVLGP